MTTLEVVIAILVLSLVGLVFLRTYQPLRRQQADQSSRSAAQQAFLALSDLVQRSVTGCTFWKVENRRDGGTSLVTTSQGATTTIDLFPEEGEARVRTGEQNRRVAFGISLGPPDGNLRFEIPAPGKSEVLLHIHRDRNPTLHFEQTFPVRCQSATGTVFFPKVEF